MKICKETNRRYPEDKKKVATKKEYAQAAHIVQTGSEVKTWNKLNLMKEAKNNIHFSLFHP